jgi:hypothetical protein
MTVIPGLEHRADSQLHPVIRAPEHLEKFLAMDPVPLLVEISDQLEGFNAD